MAHPIGARWSSLDIHSDRADCGLCKNVGTVKMTRLLTCGYGERFDLRATLRALARAASRFSSQARRFGGISMLSALAVLASHPTHANTIDSSWRNHEMNLKLYAINKIQDWDQSLCFIEVIHRESSWRYWISNGSHHGLGQMRSTWYKDLSPRRQIDASIAYYLHRYGSMCGALSHWQKKGWT